MGSARRSGALEVEVIEDLDQLHLIEDGWRKLAVARGNAFVTPEWFSAWRRHYGEGHRSLIATARDSAGQLQGVLPLVVRLGRRPRPARFAGSSLGDHFEPAASHGRDDEVAAAVGAALRSGSSPPARRLVLENVDAERPWWRALSLASGCGGNPLVDRRSSLPSVNLAGRTWEDYLATRSRNLRSQVGRKWRRLERDYDEVRVRWIGPDDDLAAGMATMFRLHDLRWERRSGTSSLAGARARAFHGDFAASARERGWLRLCFLEVDGQPVAGWYGWRIGGRFAYYQAGFDPAWAEHSVGFVLFSQTIQAAANEGAAQFDMLLGDEDFKGRFADSARSVCTVVIAPRLAPLRLTAGAEAGLRRAGHRLPESVRDPMKSRARSILERLPMARRR